jgi:hypothetical protein
MAKPANEKAPGLGSRAPVNKFLSFSRQAHPKMAQPQENPATISVAPFRLCHNPIKPPQRRQGLFSYFACRIPKHGIFIIAPYKEIIDPSQSEDQT